MIMLVRSRCCLDENNVSMFQLEEGAVYWYNDHGQSNRRHM